MQEKIFKMLLEENEITWQTIIYDLVKSEKMNPWDIDVSLLTQRYITLLKKLKGIDFRVSGKVLLAAAVLLRLQSNRLVGKDINELDALLSATDMTEEEFYDSLEKRHPGHHFEEDPKLIPRMPQARKRKVSIYDLVNALEHAIDTRRRRVMRMIPESSVDLPKKSVDISLVIKQVYGKIISFFSKNNGRLTFSRILPKDAGREDKVYTFMPLLYLTNQRKVDLEQETHFGEIEIKLRKAVKAVDKGPGAANPAQTI